MPTVAKPETHPGAVMGTVSYMSPEQASGEAIDFRSDQFSFGSILYEMATGEKAFQKKTAAETMSAIIREEPRPLSQSALSLPLPLRWIVERCLAKDREERYASTRDLARDLAAVRDHISEVSSGADALISAPGRKGRRRGLLPAAAVLLPLGLLAGWLAATRLLAEPAEIAHLPAADLPPRRDRQRAFRSRRTNDRLWRPLGLRADANVSDTPGQS